MALTGAVAFAPAEPGKKRNPVKAIVAGGLSGAIEICITYPTEFVKTQMQLYESAAKQGIGGLVKETVSKHGPLGLYRGLSSLLFFSVPKTAVRFYGYEMAKNNLQDADGTLSASRNLLCGLTAGVIEAIVVVTPMETIKVKLIHDQLSASPKYRGLFHGITAICKEKGLTGIYKGLTPTIVKQGSNQMIRFGVFAELKSYFLKDDPKAKMTIPQSLISGAIAGGASVLGNTPVDVVKTRMQGLEAHKYSGTVDCIKQILTKEGPMAFYKGTVPRLGRVCADVAIVMTLYEQINKALDYVWPTD